MDKIRFIKILVLFLLIISIIGCSQTKDKNINTGESWVSQGMVKWNHEIYIAGNEEVTKVEKQIGSIESSSSNETEEAPDNFSNEFLAGTKLFSIPGIKTENAIAVEVRDGYYVKAQNQKIILDTIDN